jgi:hypothetical protein
MATATAEKSFAPKARPENLTEVSAPEGKPPVELKTTNPAKVLEWAEAVIDYHQERGELLTPRGVLVYLKNNVKDEDTSKKLRRIVRDGYGIAAPAPKAKPKAKAKKAAKAKPSANGHAGNGKAKAKGKAAAPAEATTLVETTVNGIPVVVTESDSGRRRPKAAGMPARELCRWLGSKGFDVPLTKKVMLKLFAKLGDPEYVEGFVEEGHVGSGRAGQDGVFGPFGTPEKEYARALLAMKK